MHILLFLVLLTHPPDETEFPESADQFSLLRCCWVGRKGLIFPVGSSKLPLRTRAISAQLPFASVEHSRCLREALAAPGRHLHPVCAVSRADEHLLKNGHDLSLRDKPISDANVLLCNEDKVASSWRK